MVQSSRKFYLAHFIVFITTLFFQNFSKAESLEPRKDFYPVANSTGSKIRPNGSIHKLGADGKLIPVNQDAVQKSVQSAEQYKGAGPEQATDENGMGEESAVKVQATTAQNQSVLADIPASESLLKNLNTTFIQVVDGYPNEVVFTVDDDGFYYVFFYANDYLGYVNPNNGDLLYCGNLIPEGQEASIDVIDCAVNGNVNNIAYNASYPSNGQRIRDSSVLYYEDGTYLKNYNEWYYDNGTLLRSSSGSELKYRDGSSLRYYSSLYHPDGSPMYQYSELLYGGVTSRYFTYGSGVYFKDGNSITPYKSGDRDYYWPGVSRNKVARYTQNDTALQLYYPGSNSNPKFAKREDTPFEGRLFNQSGNEIYSYAYYSMSIAGGGVAFFDAEYDKDLLAYSIVDGASTYVVYQGRVAPPRPPQPQNISVTGVSGTKATVSWSLGGGNTTGYFFRYATGSGVALTCEGATDRGSSTSISLSGLTALTTYRFAVCAKNNFGMRSAATTGTFTTQALVAPPAPNNLIISDVDWDSFSMSFASGGGNTSSFSVAVALGTTAPNCRNGTNLNQTQWYWAQLAEQSDYTVSVCAKNNDDLYSTQITASVRTEARPRPPVPSNFTVTQVLDTMVDLSWVSGGGETNGYYLAIKEGGLPASCTSTGYLTISSAATTTRRLSGLKPNTLYGALLCAKNSYGLGFQSTSLSQTFSTQPATVPPAPTDLTLQSLKAKTVALSWASGGLNTASFRVVYASGTATPSCATSSAGLSVTTTSVNLTSLNPNTDYTIAICAVSEVPLYSPALVLSFRTLGPPPTPVNLRISDKHDTMLRFAWDSAGGSTLKFVLAYRKTNVPPTSCGAASGVTLLNMNTATEFSLSALKASSFVSAVVCAVDEFNLYSVPAVLTAQTDAPLAPPSPLNLSVSEIKPTSVKLSWSSGGGNTSSYKVVAALGHNVVIDCKRAAITKTNFKIITALKADTDYTFGVCAYSETKQHSVVAALNGNTRRVPMPPVSFRVVSKHDTSISVEWAPGDADTVSYIVSAKAGFVAPKCGAAGTRTYRLTGLSQSFGALKSGSTYSFSVCSVNSDKQVSKILTSLVDTTDVKVAPPSVLNLIASNVKSDALGFTWSSGGYNSLKYRVRLKAGDDPALTCTGVGSTFVSSPTYVKSSALIPGTAYTFAVCAYSESGLYSDVSRISIVTPPPPPVTGLYVSGLSKSSIRVSYKSAKGGTVGYRIAVTEGVATPDCNLGINVAAAAYTKTKLLPGQQYTIAVCARASNGVLSAPSVVNAVTYSF